MTRRRAQQYICQHHGRWIPPRPPTHDCLDCWALYGNYRWNQDQADKVVSKGRARGGGQSSKAKGRSAVQLVREKLLRANATLQDDDIHVKATSQGGCDLHLSPAAARWFPFAPEVKNTERLEIWAALRQALYNAERQGKPPILFFKRAGTPLYVALLAEDFVRLLPCLQPGPQEKPSHPPLPPRRPPSDSPTEKPPSSTS